MFSRIIAIKCHFTRPRFTAANQGNWEGRAHFSNYLFFFWPFSLKPIFHWIATQPIMNNCIKKKFHSSSVFFFKSKVQLVAFTYRDVQVSFFYGVGVVKDFYFLYFSRSTIGLLDMFFFSSLHFYFIFFCLTRHDSSGSNIFAAKKKKMFQEMLFTTLIYTIQA